MAWWKWKVLDAGQTYKRRAPRAPENGVTVPFPEFYSRIVGPRRRHFFKAKKLNTLVEYGSFRYYSTYRSGDFRHDHWKAEIPTSVLYAIQNASVFCKRALKLLNYEFYEIPKDENQ